MWHWARPGTGIKRWLALLLAAVAVAGLGVGLLLSDAYRDQDVRFPLVVGSLTLQFIPRAVRGALLLGAGFALTVVAFLGLNRSLIGLLVPRYRGSVAELMQSRQLLARGPRVTCIGGGTGMASLLRGIKAHTSNLAAVVTVADDGSSSGLLRGALAIPPPGDARQCISALADAESLMGRLLEYRFDARTPGLQGHSVGNLVLAAMTELTGSFEQALAETSRALAVRGRILPATLRDVRLFAETVGGERLDGEAAIGRHRGSSLRRVWIAPAGPPAFAGAIRAILDADLVVVGPGSLFTSVLPNLLIPGVTEALRSCRGTRVYVCNVATEPGATDEFSVVDHLAAIERHVGAGLFDVVLAHEGVGPPLQPEWKVSRPTVDHAALEAMGYRLLAAPLVSAVSPTRHDPDVLARLLLQALPRRLGQEPRRSLDRLAAEVAAAQL